MIVCFAKSAQIRYRSFFFRFMSEPKRYNFEPICFFAKVSIILLHIGNPYISMFRQYVPLRNRWLQVVCL